MKNIAVGSTRTRDGMTTVTIRFVDEGNQIVEKVYLADLSGNEISREVLASKIWNSDTNCDHALAQEMLAWSARKVLA